MAPPADPLLKWRSEFPILERKASYLLCHALGPMPRGTREQMTAYLDRWDEDATGAWDTWLPLLMKTAGLLGDIIHAAPGSVMVRENVSTLLSVLISGLSFSGRRNKVVLTQLNFPSGVYNWMAQRERGARVEVVPSHDGGLNIDTEALVAAIDDDTCVVALDHVLFRSGGLVDVAPVVEAAHRHGALVILDCYQSAGAVPVDVGALGVDFAMGGSLKWLCGGPGAAWLYVSPEVLPRFAPKATGWLSHARPFDFLFGEMEYVGDIRRFLGGTPSIPAVYAARTGYELVHTVGVEAIREKALRQTALLLELADAQGLQVNTPRAPHRRGNTVCLDFPGSEDASRRLIERGFMLDWRPGAGLRLSPHFFTTDDECRATMEEVRRLRESGTLGARSSGSHGH